MALGLMDHSDMAERIWNVGWFQAFLDAPEEIPAQIVPLWHEMMEVGNQIQPLVAKLLEKYPYGGMA